MPTTAKGFRTPAGTDPLSQGDDAIRNLAADVDGFAGWVPAGGAAGAVLAKTSAADYAKAWTAPHYVPAGGAAAQVLAKASSTDYDLAWVTPAAGGSGSGFRELAYVERNTDLTVIPNSEAGATAVCTLPAITCDGVTPVTLVFFAPSCGASAGIFKCSLFVDGAAFAVLADAGAGNASQLSGSRRYVPAAGSRVFSARVWGQSIGSSPAVRAGAAAGGATTYAPMYLRATS